MDKMLEAMQPRKIYTRRELLKLCGCSTSTAEYIIQDAEAIGRIEKCLHPVLDIPGYRINQ